MRHYLFISLVAFSITCSFAQKDCNCEHLCQCKITGKIFDLETKEALPLANIQYLNKGATADETGAFTIKNICDCRLELTFTYTGYHPKTIYIHADQPEFLQIYLAPDTKMLEGVVILGHGDHISLTSQSMAAIDENIIESYSGSALGEVLHGISGISTLETGGNVVKPVIQGLSGNRILILNNGIRVEDQQWGVEHAPAIDPLLAQRIEVVKGASSVQYGAGAIGGVILVMPPAVPESGGTSGKINFSGQSNGAVFTSSGLVEGNSSRLNNLGWRLQTTYKRGGDHKSPDYYLTNTSIREINFSAAAGQTRNNFEYEIFGSHFNTRLGILRATGLSENVQDLKAALARDVPAGSSPFSYDIKNPRQEVAHTLIKAKALWKLKDNELKIQYGFQNNIRKEFDIRRGNLLDIPSMHLSLHTHQLDADFALAKKNNRSLSLGVNSLFQQNSNITGTQTIPFIPNYTLATSGIYLIDRWDFGSTVVEAGARADYHALDVAGRDSRNEVFRSDLHFFSVSGVLGTKTPLNKRDFVSINIATGWRPPHVSELYSFGTHQSAAAIEYGLLLDSQNSVIQADLAEIKNESSIKSTLNYEHHGSSLHFNVSGYYQFINNYFYLKPSGLTTTVRGAYPTFRQQQTQAVFSGFDIDAELEIGEKLSLTGLYSYLYARDVGNNDYLLYMPSNRVSSRITYHLEKEPVFDHLDVYLQGIYYFKQHMAPTVIDIDQLDGEPDFQRNFDFMPAPEGYFLFEAGISLAKRWNKDLIEWSISSTNLLNTQYRSYTNRLKYFADDRGRNIKLGIIYHF